MGRDTLPLVEDFRALHHRSDILLLPGVWDVASASIFAVEGFPALGTTSTGICWSVGREHGWPAFIEASSRIADAVAIPVSFGIESGFSDDVRAIQDHVSEVIDAGACGINIEDGFVNGALVDPRRHVEKLQAIRALCDERDYPLFINARTDVFLGGSAELADAIHRCQRYVEAGADSAFVPGLIDENDIAVLVAEVGAPVNIYALRGVPSPLRLFELGVRRISLGCGPHQSVLGHLRMIARSLNERTNYDVFTGDWIPHDEAEGLCNPTGA